MAHLLDELGEGGHRDDLWQLGGGGPPSPQEIRRQQYDQLRQAYMRRLPDHVVTGGMMGIRLREWWETRFAPQMQQRSAAKNAAETRNRAMGFETKRRFAEAEALYRGAAVAGDAAAGAHAARLMEQCGSEGEAEDWYESAARAGHLPAADAGYVGAMVELAGATAGYPLDGRSLVPLLSGDIDDWNTAVLTECHKASGVVTRHYRYIEWFDNQGIELYDTIRDRAQLQNVAGKPEYAEIQASLANALHALQGCAGASCSWTGKFKPPPALR